MEDECERARTFISTMDDREYVKFMREVHFHYNNVLLNPTKHVELADEISNHLRMDQSMKTEEFLYILNERKSARIADEKKRRIRDFERMKDAYSKTGRDPLQILPKEVWMMVFDQLPPTDKRSVREIHSTFVDLTNRGLIEKIMLPITLELFCNKLKSPLGQRPPLAELKVLRSVSKSLRNAVDRWFETDIISKMRNGNISAVPETVLQIKLGDAADYKKFKRMTAELNDSSCEKPKRLFHRALSLCCNCDGYPVDNDHRKIFRKLVEAVDIILEAFGEDIWYFSFTFQRLRPNVGNTFSDSPTFISRYNSLSGWLSKMPNLKWLRLSLIIEPSIIYRVGAEIPEYLPPTLSHLERLDLEVKYSNWFSDIFCNKFIAANPHIRILNLVGHKSVWTHQMQSVRQCLNAMKSFTIAPPSRSLFPVEYGYRFDVSYSGAKYSTFCDTNIFQSIASIPWTINQIDLGIDADTRTSVYTIFRSLEQLKTLENVALCLKGVLLGNDISFLNMPQLKNFSLKIERFDYVRSEASNWMFLFSFQFLLFAKNLVTFVWKCEMSSLAWTKLRKEFEYKEHLGEMIDLGIAIGKYDVDKTNVWGLFPKLKSIDVELDIPGTKKISKLCRPGCGS